MIKFSAITYFIERITALKTTWSNNTLTKRKTALCLTTKSDLEAVFQTILKKTDKTDAPFCVFPKFAPAF